jgi:putative Mg2+ transporter-C (MgtC) family protein
MGDFFQLHFLFQLFLAVFLGAIIGIERETKKKEAGMRTYSLVCMGSCLFTITAMGLADLFGKQFVSESNPIVIIQAISVGIGFLGAGVIFRQPTGILGLTTAAGLWVAAAIGVAVGTSLYILAIFATFLALFILVGFNFIEARIFKNRKSPAKSK